MQGTRCLCMSLFSLLYHDAVKLTCGIMFCAVQPNNIPDVGIRYGIQIGQAFGYDFGIGIIRDICFITFTTV